MIYQPSVPADLLINIFILGAVCLGNIITVREK